MPDAVPALCNRARRRMEGGELALGMVVRLSRSGDVCRIARSAGLDFVFIDTQHGIFSLETIGHLSQVALGCGITALVRARGPRDPNVQAVLDGGAAGIVFPDVSTAEDARACADACRFAPAGRRSATTGYPMLDFRPVPQGEAISAIEANTLVVCMVETAEGLANVEEIASVDGIDVLFVGLTDLLTSLGRPGELGHPEAMEAVERVAAAAKGHGRFFGIGGDSDLDRQRRYVEMGSRFIPTASDAALLLAGARGTAAELRSLAG